MTRNACCTIVATLALAIICSIPRAAAAAVESLGEPCRAFNVLAGRVVTDPAGKEWLVLTNMNEASGMELIFIDPRSNTAKSYKAPAGAGSWALLQVPGDRLVVGTYYDGTFMVFDLKQMKFIQSIPFKGEEYIWNLALGSDGRVYGGTYRGGKLGALDLNTYKVEDLGRPKTAAPNLYLRNVSATPDGRILCHFGMEKKTTLLFDPKTKQFASAPDHLQVDRGVTWNDKYFLAGRQVMTGPELEMVKPPFPTPPSTKDNDGNDVHWAVDVLATTNQTLVLRHSNTIYRYRAGDKDLTRVFNGSLRGGVMYAPAASGEMLGVRGPEYFVLSPGKPIQFHRIPVQPGPRKTHFLEYDEHHNALWGGPTFGQTVFRLDLKTKSFENTAKVCDAGGEVYDATFLDGKVYLVAYAGGDVIEYDPQQPWDQWGNKNPRVIASVKSRGEGYIRPEAGVVLGPDKKLYSGWSVGYGKYGGAVSVTDPKTGDTELLENPLGIRQIISGVAADDAFIYVGTQLGGNGMPAQPNEAPRFAVLDRTTKKPVFEKTFEGSSNVRNLLHDPVAGRVAFSVNGAMHLFDIAGRKFVDGVEAPKLTSHDLAGRGDGRAYFASGKTVHVLDMKTGRTSRFADAPGDVETIDVGRDNEVYVSVGTEVFKLTGSAG
jgi:outer membrane protein assembly factor BamB